MDPQHARTCQIVCDALTVCDGGGDLGGSRGRRVGESAALLDLRGKAGLLEHGHRVAGMDRVAFIFEQARQSSGSEWAEPDFADLHRAGDGEDVVRATACRDEGGSER